MSSGNRPLDKPANSTVIRQWLKSEAIYGRELSPRRKNNGLKSLGWHSPPYTNQAVNPGLSSAPGGPFSGPHRGLKPLPLPHPADPAFARLRAAPRSRQGRGITPGFPTPPIPLVSFVAALLVAHPLVAEPAYDPRVLVLTFDDGHQERIAATNPETCDAAVRAIGWQWAAGYDGRRLLGTRAVAGRCERGNLFSPASQCIRGFKLLRGSRCRT